MKHLIAALTTLMAAAVPKTGVLSLGSRADATTWEAASTGIGFDVALSIKKPSPTMDELKAFFRETYDWVFFAGHFGGNELSNESGEVRVRFQADAVTLNAT